MYDVAIIGAGITGCAIARELSKYDLNVVMIEKCDDVSNGTTKANSGIVHAGYDAINGTLKAKLNVLGNEMYDNICEELNVPFKRNGSLVIGFNDDDMRTIESLFKRGIKNKVKGLEIIDKQTLESMEPNVSDKAAGALYAGTGGIVSPYELAIAMAENAAENGVEFLLSTEVTNLTRENDKFVIEAGGKNIETSFVINAAGLFSDNISAFMGEKDYKIIPRRGEYCLFDKREGNIVKRVIFQTPTERGKGILVTPTVHGNLLIGPNAIVMDKRDDVSTTAEGMDEVISGARKSVKNINMRKVITSFTGIRATPSTGDFIINSPFKGFINAAGIESPGLTSAPAVALYVCDILQNSGLKLNKKKDYNPKRENTKRFIDMTEDERSAALKENPLYGRMICRCEFVTEGDIVSAIRRPLGARSVDGVKKRTRAGMGRCQGGFCMPRVVDILSRELGICPVDVMKNEKGSYILTGRTK